MKSHLLLRLTLLNLIIFSLFRLGFFITFVGQGDIAWSPVFKAFFLGARFDLRLCVLLTLPLVLFAWKSWSPVNSRRARKIWPYIYTAFAQLWLLFYVFDFGYYGYLGGRINLGILNFLKNPDIAFGMVWQSYPVIWIVLGVYLFLYLYYLALKKWIFITMPNPWQPLTVKWGRPIAFTAIFAVGIHGRVGQYPLRWSEAFFSPQQFVSNMTLNPVLYFFDTATFTQQKGFDESKARDAYSTIVDYLGITEADKEKLNYVRHVQVPPAAKKFNVVVIVMESMALSKTNLMNNPLNPTPYLEEIAKKDGYWFSNYYSPAEGTARNMFSIMTSIPDVTKTETSSRNPLVVDQRLIMNEFEDYRKQYFLGGSANWANIRGIFSNNVKDIEIYEEGSFEESSVDVWGISDLDLLIESHRVFKQWKPNDKPFFAVIQTASFHRPYTIPEDRKSFEVRDENIEDLKKAGFYSIEQFNSMRFGDYSLGYFFQLAKNSPYYENTLFVITGDHGLPDDQGVNVSKGRSELNLEKFHVPLVLVNKTLFPESKEDTRMAGHMDIMTTVASLAGISHDNTTLGRSLINPEFDKERYSFIYNFYSEVGEYGLISNNLFYRFDNVNKGQLYRYDDPEDPLKDLKDEFPEEYKRMQSLAESIYESSRYILYHNQKTK